MNLNLKEVLKNHKEYLSSNGKKGKKANLRQADLRNAEISGADLRGANFRGANLRGADLRGADLGGAYLREADLREADLREANLKWADLSGADLRGASCVSMALFDPKGYQLIVWKYKGEFWFNTEYRSFSHKDALKHWGSPEYPDKIRGKAYCKAIKFLIKTWPWE